MSQAPPAALLRLREADVVRLCGLKAAARGLDFVTRHAIASERRDGARLEAIVHDETPLPVWAELVDALTSDSLRWHCPQHTSGEATTDISMPTRQFGCAHVAGVLTAWIRAPGDFVAADQPAQNQREPRIPADDTPPPTPPRPHMSQPKLLSEPHAKRPRSGSSLGDELARLPPHELVALAQRLFGGERDESEAQRLLASTLRDPARVAAIMAGLDQEIRMLLMEIALLGGTVTAADLDGIATRSGVAASGLRTNIAVLERHGLVFRASGAATTTAHAVPGARPWGQFVGWRVPPEIRAALPTALPLDQLPVRDAQAPPLLSRPENSGTAQEVGRVQRASPQTLMLALALLARAPRPYGPFAAEAREGAPTSADTRKPRSHGFLMIAGDLAPVPLAECARAAGVEPGIIRLARRLLLWARERGSEYPLRDLAALPDVERPLALRAGFQLWRAIEAPIELADLNQPESPVRVRCDQDHAALRPAAIATEALEARTFVLRLLEQTLAGAWYALDDLLDLIWRLNPLFLRARQMTYATPAWWIESRADRRPLRPLIAEEWHAGEGEYIRALLTGPLHWWGILDLARDDRHGIRAFRVTPYGAALLRGEDAPMERDGHERNGHPSQRSPGVLLTRDSALAVHPLIVGCELLEALQTWAKVTAIAGGRLVYTLTPDLAAAAFDAGAMPAFLLRQLRAEGEASGARIASAIEERLRLWHAKYGKTHITAGWALLEARDAATLAEALAYAPEIAARCRRLSPIQALVPRTDVEALEATLARRGYHL